MKHLLVGINAKYIHSNLAIRSIQQYALTRLQLSLSIAEFTINQRVELILAELFRCRPDSIGFSCYIWNFELICRLTQELKKILPECILYLGGPEVSYHPEQALQRTGADYVVCGEGEEAVSLLVQALDENRSLCSVPNLVYTDSNGLLVVQAEAPLLSMEQIPFVYDDLSAVQDKIIYYEGSRGCPFQCQYCLSCADQPVRLRPLAQVFTHLDFFLQQRVRQVKFVDRTFNCKPDYALAVWQYLKERDNGFTNFHFEIAAELLTTEAVAFLQTLRPGYFQFEIGVQSTHPQTLKAIRRFTNLSLLQQLVADLQAQQNIHLHLDLIVGLPYESYAQFRQSFNDVYALSPDQLQMGFLKLLKGSGLYQNRAEYGIVSSDFAPYEVLSTPHLSYAELLRLKSMEEMVEVYYNSNRFRCLLRSLLPFFPSPFCFFEALADFFIAEKLHLRGHTNLDYYNILYRFMQTVDGWDEERFCCCALFDLYSHEKAKKLPPWLSETKDQALKHAIYDFYDSSENRAYYLPEYQDSDTKQLIRQAHLLCLPYDPLSGQAETCYYLFNYQRCDLLGNAFYAKLPPHLLKGVPHEQSQSGPSARESE